MLFTRLGRFVLGKNVPEVLSPIWTSESWRITHIYYSKEFLVQFAESFPVTGRTLILIDTNYTASEKCFMSTKPPGAYQSLYIYYI